MRAGPLQNLATCYRRSETRDAVGDVGAGWTAGEQMWISLERAGGGLQDFGAGDQPTGRAKAWTNEYSDVEIRDVLRVTAGPDVGTDWRVMDVFHAAGGLTLTVERSTEVLA